MKKQSSLSGILAMLMLISLSLAACTRQGAETEALPAPSVKSADSSVAASALPKPQEEANPTMSTESEAETNLLSTSDLPYKTLEELGVELPEADANGKREYHWRNQIVKDWMHIENPQFNAMRTLLLQKLDREGKQFGDYYFIFLGRPVDLGDETGQRWIIPAGKRHDGEWMPAIYLISQIGDEYTIEQEANSYDVWFLNQSRFTNADNLYTTYFGIREVFRDYLGLDKEVSRITFNFGSQYTLAQDFSDQFPYIFLISEGDNMIEDITIQDSDYATIQGRIIEFDWKDKSGEQRTAALYNNIWANSVIKSGSQIQELPYLVWTRDLKTSYREHARIFAADLRLGNQSYTAIPPASSIEMMQFTRDYFIYIWEDDLSAKFILDSGAFGSPITVTALLTAPDKTTKTLICNDSIIDTGPMKPNDGRYLLTVRADYGESGWIEWYANLISTTEGP